MSQSDAATDWHTGQGMRAFLTQRGVILGSTKPPPAEACTRLAEAVEAIKRDAEGASVARMLGDPAPAIQAADIGKALKSLLPKLETMRAYAVSLGGDLATLDHLYSAAKAAMAEPWARRAKGGRASPIWHGFACQVADAFRANVLLPNGDPPRLANDGPVARFLAAIIPELTGEHPSAVAAIREVQRRQCGRKATP